MKQSTEMLNIDSVRSAVAKLLPGGQVTLAKTAKAAGFSARTLQRRLAEQGLNYSHLLDEMRFIKARELIQQHEKIAEVATRLGYADAGSFTRAFERWTGMAPMQYRKRFNERVHPAKNDSRK